MKTFNGHFLRLFTFMAFCVLAQNLSAAETIRFGVKIDGAMAQNQSFSGRLLIFMTANKKALETISPDFLNPEAVYMTGVEVNSLTAGQTIEVNPDILAFPSKFSEAQAGEYQVMALLDQDHSFNYDGIGAGDLVSSVVKVNIPTRRAELTLNKIVPERKIEVPDYVKIVGFESPMLSKFWGRPMKIEASVMLPPNYNESKKQTYPTVFVIHGFGGSNLSQIRNLASIRQLMGDKKIPEMIYVALNAKFSLGHHVFADSANNGPWGTALTSEFIPYLEKQFRMDAKPSGRFLTGHSSGGWSTLWLQINYPDVFGGTWSSSPDPIDFHYFTGPDLTQTTAQNFYQNAAGKDYNLIRDHEREVMSFRQYAQMERVIGDFGGQLVSFEAVFGPRGYDGRPMPLFNRDTGIIDPLVAKAWGKYNISQVLQDNWKTNGPKLKGRIHLFAGTADTFHLDEGVHRLEATLKNLKADAEIEYFPGKTHFDMYQGDLSTRIANEIYAVARPKK